MNTLKIGNKIQLTDAESITKHLPRGFYDININGRTGEFFLHMRPGFQMPSKIYGGHDAFSDRVLKTFAHMKRGMAVLLSGPKGCGKTLTAKNIAMETAMPVLCIQGPFQGTSFVSWLTELPSQCMIFIDEFEKIYADKDDRNSFLALLDGASDNKHLFVMTSNDAEIGEYFTNRPGRVRYHRKYQELPMKVLVEMTMDMVPKGKIRDSVLEFLETNGSISPDALVCMIQECLIHNEPPAAFIDYFNITEELNGYFDCEIHGMTYIPKPNLTKAKRERAESFIDCARNESDGYAKSCYSDYKELTIEKKTVWTAHYQRPFQNRYVPGSNLYFIKVGYAFEQGDQQHRPKFFEARCGEVTSISRESGFIVVKIMGEKLEYRFTKSQSRHSAAF